MNIGDKMIYALLIFIGISIGLLISKILDIRKADIDKEFLDLVDKVVFEENKEKKTNSDSIRKNIRNR